MEAPQETLAEQIAARLRRSILRGTLPPGAPIKERDSAATMGVSRTPMREAIRILAKEGLVVLRPARSPVVASPTIREIRDQVVVLEALEKLSAQLACSQATQDELDAIAAQHREVAENYDRLDALDAFELDMAFHRQIALASHNPALAETHGAYLARLWRARYLPARMRRNRDRVVGHHERLTRALLARDTEAVTAAVEAHLGSMADDIAEALAAEAETNIKKEDDS
ncbi:MAG: GntR family transcriptional regulator [Rhodobacteraceae bacterium]|jgi:DNA-binding GntR family transcriptional regulator|uniref:Transcriptional regulator n=1 Tax=Salipiger profundus TaxID=1229727 RepID=A0A1U7DAD1_9RHOB|nr:MULTISPECIES: GntR family transcriptional regulator [Salipiger]APX25137.1 transcriptional regulator [Salipiger profundus]MAB05477.1 GntR family transcriptional regulator [Paracoccaceae bacterium]GGA15573.1 transcriptional regulator [Salipiger profundus]SFD09890.1 transcriptional regulator, GntR family [Salipiger profundus]